MTEVVRGAILEDEKRRKRAIQIVVVLVLAVLAWWPGIESSATAQADAGLKRALVSFASARTLNAVLSVAQGTEVAVQPFGLGLTLSLGQAIEPVNRLVEHFSNVMLFAAVAFGIEKTLLVIGSSWPISAALTVGAICWAIAIWQERSHRWLARMIVLLLLARFAVPCMTVGSDFVFHHFLLNEYSASQKVLETTPADIEKLAPKDMYGGSNRSIWERLKDAASAPVQEVTRRYEAVKLAAEKVVDQIIRLIVIFVLQTVLFPLFFLWVFVRTGRSLLSSDGASGQL